MDNLMKSLRFPYGPPPDRRPATRSILEVLAIGNPIHIPEDFLNQQITIQRFTFPILSPLGFMYLTDTAVEIKLKIFHL